jgi:hypothetical protein
MITSVSMLGTYVVCVALAVIIYRYSGIITKIISIGFIASWLWAASMVAYSLNNKHDLLSLVTNYTQQVIKEHL